MKKALLFPMLMFIMTSIFTQNVHSDYWDGVVYFKLKNESQMKLPAFSEGMNEEVVYSRYPEFISLIREFGITELLCPFRTQTADIQNIYRIKFNAIERVQELTEQLGRHAWIDYVEMSPILRHFLTPNDASIGSQYYLDNIKAYEAWDLSTGSHNIKIAVIDDAVRVTHEDLAANIWVNPGEIPGNGIDDDGNGYIDDVSGWDAANSDNDPNAPTTPPAIWGEMAFTHGTHCSGLAAGVTNNLIGIASISHNVSLIPIKAVSSSSFFPLGIETPAEGVDYAIAAGAHIVSMSFGGEQASGFATLETLINAGHDQGIIFVAAAGNNGDGSGIIGTPNAINYPAGFTNVLAVGATNASDEKPGFSQYGNWLDVMAPGVGVYSTLAWSTPYGNQDGTSMACPIVAGALGLMKSYMPAASKEQHIFCLKQGADNIDQINIDYAGQMGAGRINVYNSLLCLQQYQSIYISEENQISIFPNPAIESLRIGFQSTSPRKISVFSITGNLIYSTQTNDCVVEMNVSTFPNGIYVCKIEENGTFSTHRFVVQK
jgi:subtilisin family serine protease